MRLLLDTHTFLWFVEGNPALSPTALRYLMDGRNERLLSVASIWEMAIKVQLGKLGIAQPFRTYLPQQMKRYRVSVLPIRKQQAIEACDLSYAVFPNGAPHKDPFDRMIVIQSRQTSIPVVGIDAIFDQYGITRIW